MSQYKLIENYEDLNETYLDKINDSIINLYDIENKYNNYILKYNNEFAIVRVLVEKNNATIIFGISDINNLFMLEETTKLIINIQNKLDVNMSVLLLRGQIEYINFFKSIGFILNIVYRDYILIDNKYYDILSYILYKKRVGLNDKV